MNNHQLQGLLGNNVVELTFERRHPKLGWSNIRGLLGTTNYPLLNGDFGFQVLNFQPPKGVGMGYDYKKYNLCVVWDMFRQEYRVFGAEQVNIRQQFPLTTPEEQETFMNYFYDYIINMSNKQKLDFMGYIGQGAIAGQLAAMTPTQQPQPEPNNISTKIQNWYGNIKNRVAKYFKK